MKVLTLLSIFLLSVVPGMATPHVYSDKQFAAPRQAVADALLALAIEDSQWSIFVVSEKDWKAALRKGERGHTAFTLIPHKLTYINAQWVESVRGDPLQIAPILAHEYGHILCGCSDERMAERYARFLSH